MSEMVKRVADAIDAVLIAAENAEEDYRELGSPVPERCARAAILAMREPTGAMADEAIPGVMRHQHPAGIWRTMIDAALK